MSKQPAAAHAVNSFEQIRIRHYTVNGKPSSKKQLAAQPFIVAGTGLSEADTAYGFATEAAFCRWAAESRHADRFARAIGSMKLGQQLEGTATGLRSLKKIEAATKRISSELKALSKETGLAMNTPEFFMRAAASRSVLEPPIFDPALLFNTVNLSFNPPAFGGASIPVFTAMPSFFGFNDRASGALVSGLCTLFDRTFFRGAATFMVGVPGATFVLDELGFDNRAASGLTV